ncbi:MAG: Hsp70 family protein, partial [Rectinema sp.]
RHFGYGGHIRTMTGKTLEVPHWITNQVASFYALPLGDVVKARQVVRELMYDADRKSELKGLIEFLDRNLAFGLFRMIDDAKIALSSEDSASIAFDVPPHISLHETVTREDFERIIGKRVATAEALVLKAVADAGIEPGDVAHVVRVGGSSRVPIFVEMLERLFPGKVREGEVYTSISAGLLKAHSLGFSGD